MDLRGLRGFNFLIVFAVFLCFYLFSLGRVVLHSISGFFPPQKTGQNSRQKPGQKPGQKSDPKFGQKPAQKPDQKSGQKPGD